MKEETDERRNGILYETEVQATGTRKRGSQVADQPKRRNFKSPQKTNGLRRMDLSQPEYKRRTVEGIQQKAAVRYQPMELKSKKR